MVIQEFQGKEAKSFCKRETDVTLFYAEVSLNDKIYAINRRYNKYIVVSGYKGNRNKVAQNVYIIYECDIADVFDFVNEKIKNNEY